MGFRRLVGVITAGVMVSAVAGCHGLLDVSDPTLVQDQDVANASGAYARWLGAVANFEGQSATLANDVALISDERMVDIPGNFSLTSAFYLDRRNSEAYEASVGMQDPHLNTWDQVLTTIDVALPSVRAYAQADIKGDLLALLFAAHGYATLQLAEDMCPGFPLNGVTPDNLPILSGPLTTDSAIHLALTRADSALADVHDSTVYKYFAQVVKGRALLDLGQYADAAAAVTGVPVDFVYLSNHNTSGNFTPFYANGDDGWDLDGSNPDQHFAVGDTQGVNGLPFVSALDPRVPTKYERQRYLNPADSLYDQLKYTDNFAPMVIASGVEAQLIVAEAAINAGDPNWFAILNTLRATAITPAMSPLTVMPSAMSDQIDLLYRERAFWLYLTGRRLGDMRRLIRNYGRSAETVFPTGPYAIFGEAYGTATAIPFSLRAQGTFNPHITTGCTTR